MEMRSNARCEICNRNLSKTDFEQHVLSKNHIRKCLHNNFIIISNVPPFISMGDLIKFLSDYGEIKRNIAANEKDVVLEFRNHKPVEILLSKTVYINGAKLNICEVFANRHEDSGNNYPNILAVNMKKEQKKVNDPISFNNQLTPFDSQLTTFLHQVLLTEKEIVKNYEPVCKELDSIFQAIFPKAKTYAFGSTVVGLGFKNCDLDLYLNIGIPVIEENDKTVGPHIITSDRIFSLASKILNLNKQKFKKFVFIQAARVPIIKFTYQPTNVQCDLSFRNSFGVFNSQLVKYYLSLDARLKPFALIIKYWISNRSEIIITKYAIMMLIIFYFQQLGIVPPFIDLQRNCEVPLTVNGWQVNFSKESSFCIKNNEKDSSIPSLLQRFFDFYANYDFKTNVICPYDGRSHSKNLFFDPENLPTSMNMYKKYLKTSPNANVISIWKPMCVQDPQELCQNVTHNIMNLGLQKFQEYCASAATIVRHCSKHNYQNLLASIFNLKNYNKSVKPTEMHHNFVLDICPNDYIVQKSIEQKNDLIIRNNWSDMTLSIFKNYLKQVLNLNVETVNGEGTTSSENQSALVLRCTGTDRLWNHRKINFATEKLLMPLEKEIEITKTLLRKMKLNDIISNATVNIECHFEKRTEPNLYIRFEIKDKGCSENVFLDLSHHLLGKLPNLIKKTFNIIRQMKNLNLKLN